jgi:prolyl oligopeptidase
MTDRIDRRRFIAGSTALLAAPLWPTFSRALDAPGVLAAPVARIEPARDTYFGETLTDPYRWMENDKDPEWLPYLTGQNAHTRAVLDGLPMRSILLKRIQQLSGDTVATSSVQRAGTRTFFTQRPLNADNYKLFVRSGSGETRVLVDPTAMSDAKSHVSLDWWVASPDGTYVAYGLSKDGSEDSTLHVLNVADSRDLPDRIPNTQGAHPAWLDDGSGFFYNQLTGAVGSPDRFLDSQARFHRLGTDPALDPVVMKRGLDAAIVYDRIQMPVVLTSAGASHAVLILTDVRTEVRAYTAPLADLLQGKARWAAVCGFEDEVTDVAIHGPELFLLVNHGTPRGRIVKTPLAAPDIKNASVVVPQGATVFESLSPARDAFYVQIMDGGINRLARLGFDGQLTDIALPFDGTISHVHADAGHDGVLISFEGWLQPDAIYAVGTDGRVVDSGINPKVRINVGAYESKRLFATAKDGTKVPYTLIYRKGLKQDGSAPLWVSAYGSYGLSTTPRFRPRILALLDAGAVVGYACVRGGGEYGREWHKAGQLDNKPNTWRDLIAVCEDAIAKHYTSPAHLAIGGGSAGGITVGRAMTERPDLFAAVTDFVGWSNPLRYVVEQNGYGEEPEWGAIATPEGYRALKGIDSYQAVRDKTAFPAVLLTTGVTDPRVAPFHVAKMTARLQAANSSGKPILLRVEFDAGHGIGSTRSQQDREAADVYAFLLWQLQPPKG